MSHVQQKEMKSFRDYTTAAPGVVSLYAEQREKQCLCYVKRMHDKYNPRKANDGPIPNLRLSCWAALEKLSGLTDASDPDVSVPNMQHAFQTAEGARAAGQPDWLQLCALMHDLGKVLYLKGCDEDGTSTTKQYGVVGDTFVVGYPRQPELVFSEFNGAMTCPCEAEKSVSGPVGFEACWFSYGHDEYLWRVIQHNQAAGLLTMSADLPWMFLYIVRFHSFHAWHEEGAYKELVNSHDLEALQWLQAFCKFDLYTKSDTDFKNIDELKNYYDGLMRRYLGCSIDDAWEW
jgi:inositol oxygenase